MELVGRLDRVVSDRRPGFSLNADPQLLTEAAACIREMVEWRDRTKIAYAKSNDQVCQSLGKALGYPWFKDDQVNFPRSTEADGVCVGEHVAESIADEAASRISALIAEVAALRGEREDAVQVIEAEREDRELVEDRLNDYGKSVAKEALAYRNALLLVKDRLKTWPIDDHKNCMCGSSIDSHSIGSGHSPVAVADHAINLLIQQIEETLNDPMGI
jgi:hypothetical protein